MSIQSTSQQHLIISALAEDRPGIINDLSLAITDAGCNILNSRMTVLGSAFAIMLRVQGSWSAIAKLETQLPGLQKKLILNIITRRAEEKEQQSSGLPYLVEVIALDQPGIIHHLASFFSSRNINILDMYTDSYQTSHGNTHMLSVNLTLNLPVTTQIAHLRDEFLDFCDSLNLDAVMEPVKG
ncbi:MAG: ACT domain-containing protein [Thiohalomonadaceae bacterium]